MFKKILIANRGEIACRIARTAKRMGIATVAVYSEPERAALHVRCCDQGAFIGAAVISESYLNGPRILAAAVETGAEAIHPGYGFLSENPQFAEACADHGITFIGPPASAIRAMGNKSAAKEIMGAAGVPMVASYHGEDQRNPTLSAAADEIGYPVLLKAVAGGGGKGMRIVHEGADFAEALAAVQREATASFGDGRVLIEQYLPAARHVEVQVFADEHGNAVHLFERDCSIQRRYQKVIEESPAPDLDDDLRQKMGRAAIAGAQSMGYVGAGTVEFLLDAHQREAGREAGQFYFMEMNTRLQVEHPVTEMVTGQDLVEWQLQVAAGLPLPLDQPDLRLRGHAMEARIYAENPDNDFLPASGVVAVYRHGQAGAHLRIDSGVGQGDAILPHYDPMIAKLIVWGPERESARARLRSALADFDILGVTTNLGFLHQLTGLDDFITAKLDTRLIERNRAALLGPDVTDDDAWLAIATLFELGQKGGATAHSQTQDPFSPWSVARPWQLNLPGEGSCTFVTLGASLGDEQEYVLRYQNGEWLGRVAGEWVTVALMPLDDGVGAEPSSGRWQFQRGARIQTISVDKVGEVIHINIGGNRRALRVVNPAQGATWHAPESGGTESGNLTAPMPGTVVAVHVATNQLVTRGEPLLTLEAMKMEHTINATQDGVVAELFFRQGDSVREGEPLLRLEHQESKEA